MKNISDLRVIRTKKFIEKAFYELTEEKSFEKIKVSDITKRAMINRATFYSYYKDKYDLLNSLEEKVLDDLKAFTSSITKESLLLCLDQGLPFPHVVKILSYIQENTSFFNLTVREAVDFSFFYKIGNLISITIFNNLFPEMKNDKLFSKYSSHFVIALYSGITSQWVKTGMKEDKLEMASLITKIASKFLSF